LYLEKLGSSIRVKFEGYKELKSGKTKEEISTRIFKFGEDKGSFGKLSGGEKARVDLATILAQSSLINSSSPTGGLNLTIVDEILESLDETGLKSVLKSMNGLDQYVILVTHGKVESSEGYNKIKIVKRNGISSLEIE
jgi:exonuclease SbcC